MICQSWNEWGIEVFPSLPCPGTPTVRNLRRTHHLAVSQVSCEGYAYAEDPYILQGSCQLIYSLNVPRTTRLQEEEGPRNNRDSYGQHEKERGGLARRLGTFAALGVVGFILYNIVLMIGSRFSGAWGRFPYWSVELANEISRDNLRSVHAKAHSQQPQI